MYFDSLTSLSSTALYISFLIYLVAIIPLGLSVKSKGKAFSIIGIALTWVGFILQLLYFVTRWYVSGHAPVSNLYEFMTFFGIMLVGSFLIIYHIFRQSVIGLFALPIALLILGFANAFSKDISPLVPSLQSGWLQIHVTTVAFSSAILSIAFITGIIFLLKTIHPEEKSNKPFFLELVMYFLVIVFAFISVTSTFSMIGYNKNIAFENYNLETEVYQYKMPAIVVPKDSIVVSDDYKEQFANQNNGILEIPNSIDSKKLNSLIWSFLAGSLLYILIRLFTRRKIISLLKPLTQKVNATTMDEVTYRAIIIGFPLFALGGLIFGSIWAQMAWGRFWGWDPKEVWSLITFLFYAVLLHLRIGGGLRGEKTAWMAIIGFSIIVFNQVFVNLVIAGLHSYA
ncbi:c-type cytochrome biogenesis protein CcsB [Oceanobacillus neutriphilus]|uniref:C-type cytochrome biogenesis protein CcsB n=1 Tax=Oceanobacillus neutriphilus TaxID=531815 RepID=A0ABQ2NUP2_9BACI|nr:c-type cytochrome biogenesis protein CcsB [Oceanobacillus neutriphilus]GGP10990.1 c-type cytochrome biogenesis protein CcsB [Oceanobacillus neutriphilus]